MRFRPYFLYTVFFLLLIVNGCPGNNQLFLGQEPPGDFPEKFAPGVISTMETELNAVFSADNSEFYFGRNYYGDNESGRAAIWEMRFKNGKWSDPYVTVFSDGKSDVNPAISKDGKKIFFGSSREDTWGARDIYVSYRKKDGTWSKAENLGKTVNSSGNDNHPSVTANGTLYFHSDKPGGFGKQDIYFSKFSDGIYSAPVNLGENINTEFADCDAFIDPEERYIIFTSLERPDSYGGADLYISYKTDGKNWTKPKNLGEKINTEHIDFCPKVSNNGKYLFFSRYKEGTCDIYWVSADFIKEFRE